MNNKKLIRLTEADLHRIVNESVKYVLTENEQLITENKLQDLIKQYGAAAVLSAAMAGGLGSAAYNYADHGNTSFNNRPTTHLVGHNMPSNHSALMGNYNDGDKAVLGMKVGPNAHSTNSEWK